MKIKRLFLSFCITALSLVACNHQADDHFSFKRRHYDLMPGVTNDDLEGSPWINSNIGGMVEQIKKPELKDDFYASINYESLIDGTLGPFEQSSYNAYEALTSILDGSASFPNKNLFSYTKQLLVEGVGPTLKTTLDNLDVNNYISSKQAFMGEFGLFNISKDDDYYFIYFNDGYSYEYGGLQMLAYLGYYGEWYPEYQPFEDAAITILYDIYSSIGYSDYLAENMSRYGIYCLQRIMFNPVETVPQWNTVSEITIASFKNALLDAGLSLEDNIRIPDETKAAIINLASGLNTEDALYYEYVVKGIYSFEHRHLIGANNYKPISSILASMGYYFDEYDLSGADNTRAAKRMLTLMLPLLYEKAYIHLQGTQENKDTVEDLIINILTGYKEMIADVDWLTDETKATITRKLDLMGFTSCYADDIKNFPTLDETSLYTMNLLDIYDDYHTTIVSLKVAGNLDIENTIGSGMHTYTVNAFYDPTANEFVILNGIVTGGFITEHLEETYGRIGTVIGHEISHAFDSSGALFNEYGQYNKSGWWAKEDMTKFKDRVSNLRKFWNKIITHDGLHVKGSRIDGEATADMGGVGVMLKLAEKEENFDYQLFFKAYAQMWKEVYSSLDGIDQDAHPYAYLRTNVTVAQFDEFYEAFGIKKGDGMYIPENERVKIW